MIVHKISKPLLVTIVLLLSGCGYYNPYVDHGSRPISLHHSMWPNRTTELGLENTLFQAQSDWLRKSPLITLTDSSSMADYELTGSIDRFTYPEISFDKYREGTQGRAELTVSFAITDKKTGKIVWQRKDRVRKLTFHMSQNPNQLQANRRAALQEIADDFGEEIYLFLIGTLMRPEPLPVEPITSYPLEETP